jgi:hypothetical protein
MRQARNSVIDLIEAEPGVWVDGKNVKGGTASTLYRIEIFLAVVTIYMIMYQLFNGYYF